MLHYLFENDTVNVVKKLEESNLDYYKDIPHTMEEIGKQDHIICRHILDMIILVSDLPYTNLFQAQLALGMVPSFDNSKWGDKKPTGHRRTTVVFKVNKLAEGNA